MILQFGALHSVLSFQYGKKELSDTSPRGARLGGPTLKTNAIQDVDIDSLPDGIHALHQDKETLHDTYPSPAQAAKALDNKVEFKYIER